MKKNLLLSACFIIVNLLGAQTTVKRVLMEEFTTCLCGACPPKTWQVNQWHEQNTANTVMLTIHEGFGVDSMSNSFTDGIEQEFANPNFGFAPAIMLDRVTYPWVSTEPYMTVNGFDTIATRIINTETPRVTIDIQGTYNPATRQISATATANFLQAVPSGDYRISIYLVEDSVSGSGYGYDQKCYDANFANTHYPGQYDPNTDMIHGYYHRHVLRSALSPAWGSSGVIPNAPVTGTNYSTTVNYTVPSNYNDSRISLVAFVSHYGPNPTASTTGNGNRWVLNANEARLSPVFSTGITNCTANLAELNVYPNPSEGPLTIAGSLAQSCTMSVYVSDLNGRRVLNITEGKTQPAGEFTATIQAGELAPGIYFVVLQTDSGIMTRKLVVQ